MCLYRIKGSSNYPLHVTVLTSGVKICSSCSEIVCVTRILDTDWFENLTACACMHVFSSKFQPPRQNHETVVPAAACRHAEGVLAGDS